MPTVYIQKHTLTQWSFMEHDGSTSYYVHKEYKINDNIN